MPSHSLAPRIWPLLQSEPVYVAGPRHHTPGTQLPDPGRSCPAADSVGGQRHEPWWSGPCQASGGPTSCRQDCSGLQQGPQGQTPRLHCHLLTLTSAMDTFRGLPCPKSSTRAVPSGPSQGDTQVWQERLQQDRMGSLTRTVRISRGESGPAPPEGPGASFRTAAAPLHHLRPVLQPSPFSDHLVFSHTTPGPTHLLSKPNAGPLLSLPGPPAQPPEGARCPTMGWGPSCNATRAEKCCHPCQGLRQNRQAEGKGAHRAKGNKVWNAEGQMGCVRGEGGARLQL